MTQATNVLYPPWQEAVAEVWRLFKETDARFKETDARLDARFKETDAQFKETRAQFKETDARFKETDAQFKETRAQLKKTDEKIRALTGLFSDQWGKMIEVLVKPSALRLFQERGIQVHYIYPRAKAQMNGNNMEVDLLLENSDEVVVIEVKSNLRDRDVTDFLKKLKRFLRFFPRYENFRVYGGVAGLDISEGADKYAYRKGLFVLTAIGEGMAQIKNDAAFRPTNFGHKKADAPQKVSPANGN